MFWSFCVDYLEPTGNPPAGRLGGGKSKVGDREVLSPEDFPVFAKLRELRKAIAQQEAVPVYTLFTNEQLAQMVQTKAASKAALERIAGVGDARTEKYGPRLLEFLAQAFQDRDEASGKSV